MRSEKVFIYDSNLCYKLKGRRIPVNCHKTEGPCSEFCIAFERTGLGIVVLHCMPEKQTFEVDMT